MAATRPVITFGLELATSEWPMNVAMNQPNAFGQQTIREEERVLGISYDRAIVMVPRLIREAGGADAMMLGDGYFLSTMSNGTGRRELTVRLGRQGADTRFAVRVESFTHARTTLVFFFAAILTAGLGVLFLLPWLHGLGRREARERDLVVHRVFRAIEDAVAEQGAAPSYRLAAGVEAFGAKASWGKGVVRPSWIRRHVELPDGRADR
jgi:hypothetical protein